MLLFYVRHGDPIYSPDKLTPLGKRQAEAVAKRLALYGVDKVYSSTSNRAYETAKPTAELLHLPIERFHWANESMAHKDFAVEVFDGVNPIGRTWCWSQSKFIELFNTEEMRSLGKKWYEHPALSEYREQFERGMARVEKEVYAFLAAHGYEHDPEANCYHATHPSDERIALFAHEGFSMAFMSVLLDIPYPMYATHFAISHSGMTVIEMANKEGKIYPRVLQASNDSHLYREGLPTNYQNRSRF